MTAARLADYLAKWALQPDGAPFETPASWLCFVRRGETQAVLKLFKPHADEQRSAAALAALGGPCVRVLDGNDDAVLLERCLPGTPLAAWVADPSTDDQATAILADVIAALHRSAPLLEGWPRLEDWGHAFRRIRVHDHPALTPDLVNRAEAAFYDLCASTTDVRLLHGDIHHENVLRHGNEWRVIDPKGIAGDRTYEVVTVLHNPTGHGDLYGDPSVMQRRIATYARRLDLDPERILRWCFAQSTLSAAWHLEDGNADAQIAGAVRVARVAERLLSA